MNKKNLGVSIIILGMISGILFFVAGNSIGGTGEIMTEIQSVAGNSVAESYYQSMGELAKGVSIFMYGIALSVITISVGFGSKQIIQQSIDETLEEQIIKNRSSNFFENNLTLPKTETFEDLPEL